MKCICCGKKFASENLQNGWQKGCIRNFFGTDKLPVLDVDKEQLEVLAETVYKKVSRFRERRKNVTVFIFGCGTACDKYG